MAGPNKQFDQDQVLDKAVKVFWDKGYEASSMQDLVQAMGINRASMYQTYGNKYALYMASMDRYLENSLFIFTDTSKATGSPLNNLRELLQRLVEGSLQGEMNGCFLNNTAIELGPHDPKVAEKIRYAWGLFEDAFAVLFQRAIDCHEINADTDVRRLAQLTNNNLLGLMAKTKINTRKQELFDDIELFIDLVRTAA